MFLLFKEMLCEDGLIQSKKYDKHSKRASKKYFEDDVLDLLNEFQKQIAYHMLKSDPQGENVNYPLDEAIRIYEQTLDIVKKKKTICKYQIDSCGKLAEREIDFNYIASAGLFHIDYEDNKLRFIHSDFRVFLYSDMLIKILLPKIRPVNQLDTIIEFLSEIDLSAINIKNYFKIGIEQYVKNSNTNSEKAFRIFDTIADVLIYVTLKGYKTVTNKAYEDAVEREQLITADVCLFSNCLTILNWTQEALQQEKMIWSDYKDNLLLNTAVRNMIGIMNANSSEQMHEDGTKKMKILFDRIKLDHIRLDHMDLSRLFLENLEITNSELERAVFDKCNLSNAHFENTVLKDASFKNVFAIGLHFRDSELENVDFTGAVLYDSDFQGANLTDVKGLETCVFVNTKMDYAKFTCDDACMLQITEKQFNGMIFDKITIVKSDGEKMDLSREEILEYCSFLIV